VGAGGAGAAVGPFNVLDARGAERVGCRGGACGEVGVEEGEGAAAGDEGWGESAKGARPRRCAESAFGLAGVQR
jgi:hypothetical protein